MFTTDTQTVTDLAIFGKGGQNSIYALYNHTHTREGAAKLEEWLRYPLSNADSINKRSSIIRYFAETDLQFPFEQEHFDTAAQYLAERDERTRLHVEQQSIGQKLSSLVATDTSYKNIVRGIVAVLALLQSLAAFVEEEVIRSCDAYRSERDALQQQLSNPVFEPLLKANLKVKLSAATLAALDSIIRFRHRQEINKLLQYIYSIDAYLAVGRVGKQQNYHYAAAMDGDDAFFDMRDVKHPGVAGAKGNDLKIDSAQNVVFLTGANMAGKSTFMKSVAVAFYLAHCGFPIAAAKMTFTVLDGIYTTINLPDNLGIGASHFYAEVLRVKTIAEALHQKKRLFVLFDEMFRGTNVKDANEATIEVVKGFAQKRQSLFIISTHIIEAADQLKEESGQIQYRFLPTKMQGHTPVYTYQLEEGVTADRHGMIIIRNEGILEMLEIAKAHV